MPTFPYIKGTVARDFLKLFLFGQITLLYNVQYMGPLWRSKNLFREIFLILQRYLCQCSHWLYADTVLASSCWLYINYND